MTIMLLEIFYLALVYFNEANAFKDPHFLEQRTAIVHLFEWKYKDIAEECEKFLGPKGFGGVQISPVNENMILPGRPWYERYQPISYKLITRSGTEAEFADMVKRCNAVKVRVYVDAVINHMTKDLDNAVGTGGSKASPKDKSYPEVPYTQKDFNQPCLIKNYHDKNEVRNCELEGLHDLNQTEEHVKERITEFMNRVIDHGVAGFRIDAAKHMWPDDLQAIYLRLKNLNTNHGFPPNSKPFIYQEVIDLGGEPISKLEYTKLADVIEFQYGIILGNMFRGRDNLGRLPTISNVKDWNLIPSEDAVVMVDNHDNQRGHGAGGSAILTYKTSKQYKMAVAFMLAYPYGIPRIMSSFEFSDPNQGPPANADGTIISPDLKNIDCGPQWVCEHHWRQLFQMVEFRNLVGKSEVTNIWSGPDNQMAFARGKLGFIAFNAGHSNMDVELNVGLPPKTYCDIISASNEGGKCTGKTITVTPDGKAKITIPENAEDGVIAIHV